MRFFALQELANRRPVPVDYPVEKLSEYYGKENYIRHKAHYHQRQLKIEAEHCHHYTDEGDVTGREFVFLFFFCLNIHIDYVPFYICGKYLHS